MSRLTAFLFVVLAALVALSLGAHPATAAGATPTPTRTRVAGAATPRATPSATPRATPSATPRATSAATRAATPAATPTRLLATAAAGLETYKRLGCIGCHKLTVAGSRGGLGPSHDHIATVAAQRIAAADYTGSAMTAAEYIAESITHPEAYIVPDYIGMRYRMPQYPSIRSDEVAALVALLMQQK